MNLYDGLPAYDVRGHLPLVSISNWPFVRGTDRLSDPSWVTACSVYKSNDNFLPLGDSRGSFKAPLIGFEIVRA
jgi:hypothetical protein